MCSASLCNVYRSRAYEHPAELSENTNKLLKSNWLARHHPVVLHELSSLQLATHVLQAQTHKHDPGIDNVRPPDKNPTHQRVLATYQRSIPQINSQRHSFRKFMPIRSWFILIVWQHQKRSFQAKWSFFSGLFFDKRTIYIPLDKNSNWRMVQFMYQDRKLLQICGHHHKIFADCHHETHHLATRSKFHYTTSHTSYFAIPFASCDCYISVHETQNISRGSWINTHYRFSLTSLSDGLA